MAKNAYVGVSDTARKISNMYVGVNTSYTPVEYIESTGTQFIDTGFKANNNTKVEFKCAFNNTTTTEAETLFCCRDLSNTASVSNSFTLAKLANGTQLYNQYNTTSTSVNFTYSVGTMYTFTKDKNVLYVDGTAIRTDATATFQSTKNMLLFCFDNGSRAYILNNFGALKLYGCKIWDNGTLVRDYTPVKDQDNIGCLYESVENKLYYNNGGGSFNVGTATGNAVSLGQKAKKIIKGYVGANGVAKVFYSRVYATLKNTLTVTAFTVPAVTHTADYFLVAGGQATSGATPVKTVEAINNSLVISRATDLPTQSSYSIGVNFNNCGIVATGKTASSGSSRTNQVIAYANDLTRQTLTTANSIFYGLGCANDTHMIIGGGTNYSSFQTAIYSYDTNFTKTTPTSMSISRVAGSIANLGNHIMACCGGTSQGAVDFYSDTNVRTTSTNPYNKNIYFPCGISTPEYAVFFGGSSNDNLNNAYTDVRAYNLNKVLISFDLPINFMGEGFYYDNIISLFYGSRQLTYNRDLVLLENKYNYFNCNAKFGYMSTNINNIGAVFQFNSHNLRIIDL